MDTIKILEGIYQPHIVNTICKKLCEKGVLTGIKEEGGLGLRNIYISL